MASKPEKYTDAKLQAFAEDRIADCVSYDGSDRKGRRELALAYKAGDMPDLVPGKDQSSVVSQDLADAIAWLLPDLMRVFCASDKIVAYEPENPGDEEHAQQATDYVNWLFLRECDGEMLLRDVLDDGLTLGNGVIKHWWDPTPEYRIHTFTDLSEDQFAELVASDDVEVLEHSAKPDPSAAGLPALLGAPGSQGLEGAASLPDAIGSGAPPPRAAAGPAGALPGAIAALSGAQPTGVPPQAPPSGGMASGGVALQAQPGGVLGAAGAGGAGLGRQLPGLDAAGIFGIAPPPLLHDVKVRRTVRTGRIRIVAVPDEDFGIESAATGLNERECRFCYHRETPTRSQLIERGYDKDMVWELGSVAESNTDADRRRRGWYDGNAGRDDYEDRAAERVEVFECYALLDYDGDGVAEWHQIIMAGPSGSQKLLYQTEWGGMLPFTDVVPDPVPHVWRGRSLYDRLRDIQRVNTALTRKMLDSLYQSMEPQRAVDMRQIENHDALYDIRLGGVIRTKGDPRQAIMDLAVPFVGQQAAPIIDAMQKTAERRVGVGEQSAGLSADALQNQTATAIAATQSTSGMRKEDYARNIQMGLRRLFSAILHLTCEHQDRPRTIRLRDKWVDVDPRSWNAEMDVTVNVGLGAGNRDRDLSMLQGIAQKQEMIVQVLGPENPWVNLTQLAETYQMMVESSGIKSADRFFPTMTPEMIQQLLAYKQQQAQAAQQKGPDPKLVAMQQKAQMDAMLNQQKMAAQQQLNVQALQHKQALAEADLQADMRVREADMAHRMQVEQQKSERQIIEAQLKAQMAERVAQVEAEAKIRLESAKAEADMRLRERELALEFELKQAQMMLDVNRQNATNLEMPE